MYTYHGVSESFTMETHLLKLMTSESENCIRHRHWVRYYDYPLEQLVSDFCSLMCDLLNIYTLHNTFIGCPCVMPLDHPYIPLGQFVWLAFQLASHESNYTYITSHYPWLHHDPTIYTARWGDSVL